MNMRTRISALLCMIVVSCPVLAQADDSEQLKIAALEALISAPPERALPLARKVLLGDHSNEVKSRALFVLSQIDGPEAQNLLLEAARQGTPELRTEAIRMIGIGGNSDSLTQLRSLYAAEDLDIRAAVLEAYLIADDEESVYELAVAAENEEEFEAAVETLGAMDANDSLRRLRDRTDMSVVLIEAFAISGDTETLQEFALDASDTERQVKAIEALGIVGGTDVEATLVEIYRSSDSATTQKAALQGMLIADYDDGVLELYRASEDSAEKKVLLKFLVAMDSEAVWDLIDGEFDGTQ